MLESLFQVVLTAYFSGRRVLAARVASIDGQVTVLGGADPRKFSNSPGLHFHPPHIRIQHVLCIGISGYDYFLDDIRK